MKRFAVALALTCVLSFSALGGEMPTCGITSQGPSAIETLTPGEVPTSGIAEPSLTDALVDGLLNIFSVL